MNLLEDECNPRCLTGYKKQCYASSFENEGLKEADLGWDSDAFARHSPGSMFSVEVSVLVVRDLDL